MGELALPLWIKCDEPLMVMITATVIKPKLLPINICFTSTFAILDFPVTYVGLTSARTVFVRNDSEASAMFCVLGELENKAINLRSQQFLEFKNFDVYPKEGLAESKEVKALHFKFQPKQSINEPLEPFYFCSFRMNRIRCRYVTKMEYHARIDEEYRTNLPIVTSSFLSDPFFAGSQEGSAILRHALREDEEQLSSLKDIDYLRFYIHAMAERPSVVVVPDEIILLNLVMGKQERRVLEIRNNSVQLPIIASYAKVPFIDIEPKLVFIKMASSVQLAMKVVPQQIGTFNSTVQFDLCYYDYPKESGCKAKIIGKSCVKVKLVVKSETKLPLVQPNQGLSPNYIHEVGKHCQDVRFGDKVELPKATIGGPKSSKKNAGNALIAFPNDRPMSLRPWRSDRECRTIFANLPRYIPPTETANTLTNMQKQFKTAQNNYYATYIKEEGKKRRSILSAKKSKISDYETSNKAKLLCKDLRCPAPEPLVREEIEERQFFIALTPMETNNITIFPVIIHSGPIATHEKYHFKITVRNMNQFSIYLTMRAEQNVRFLKGDKQVVKMESELDLALTYVSSSVGYCSSNIEIIVNASVAFVVTIVADVCSRYLIIDKDNIQFNVSNSREFVAIRNPMNVELPFSWHLPCTNFNVDASSGVVRPYSTLMCLVSYFPDKDGPMFVEVEFLSGEKSTQVVRLSAMDTKAQLHFVPNELLFENIPLNIPTEKRVTIINKQATFQEFSFRNTKFSQFVDVLPSEGIVTGYNRLTLSITLTLPVAMEFSTKIYFDIAGATPIALPIKGNVIYPDVKIYPTRLEFQKMPASSRAVVPFTVRNNSKAMAIVKFALNDSLEYNIYDGTKWWESNLIERLTLEPLYLKQLFLHFTPFEAYRDMSFLPIVINDILGPAENTMTLARVGSLPTVLDGVFKIAQIPQYVPYMRVVDYATAPKLRFSTLHIKLYQSLVASRVKDTQELRICNLRTEKDSLCVRLDNLKPPLHIDVDSQDKRITFHESSFVCLLSSEEEVLMQISFRPQSYGTYAGHLPVFVRSDNSDTAHNVIVITGQYPAPTIETDSPIIYMKPVPLQVKFTCSKRFTLSGHTDDCVVDCEVDYENAFALVSTDLSASVSRLSKTISVTWQLEVGQMEALNVGATISCSCNAKCKVQLIGCAENCLLTTYAFMYVFTPRLQNVGRRSISQDAAASLTSRTTVVDDVNLSNTSKENSHSLDEFLPEYPSFPRTYNKMSKYMKGCIRVMEGWMYTQGFFGKIYHRIPEDISLIKFDANLNIHCRNKADNIRLPFIELLSNLAGQNMQLRFNVALKSDDWAGKILYCHELYQQAMDFLDKLGALLTNVRPEYLLEYHLYLSYMENNYSKSDEIILKPKAFARYSKQCWLDTILQTYKVLVLNQMSKSLQMDSRRCPPHAEYLKSTMPPAPKPLLFSTIEVVVLQWLYFHYAEAKCEYWSDAPHLHPKDVTFFDENMENGFVFAGVTLAYCPYLSKHFRKLYLHPRNYEEIMHNNIIVIQAWKLLNLSVDVSPLDIAWPHALHNLVLSAYLFEVLPDMYPSETIEFCAGLSQTYQRSLEIKNSNHFPVAYKAIFIGKLYEEAFDINATMYVVPPNGKCNIVISYKAKFAQEYICTLILSGECQGYRYARSKVVTLIARPDVSYVVSTIDFTMGLYLCRESTYTITSPYKTRANYKIQIALRRCISVGDVQRLPYQTDIEMLEVLRFFPMTEELVCDCDGKGALRALCTTVFNRTTTAWLYFSNENFGLFCVKVIIKINLSRVMQEVLQVFVPKKKAPQEQQSAKEVYKTVYVCIPRRNKLMRKTIMEMLLKTCAHETEFLKSILTAPSGWLALERLMILTTQSEFLLIKSECYKVYLGKGAIIDFPKMVEFRDCYAKEVKIPFKHLSSRPLPKNFSITLRSLNDFEVRCYKIIFTSTDD